MTLTQDKSGSLWVGTEDEGVWRYDEKAPEAKRWKQFTTKDGLGDDNAYAIACDNQGRIWIGHVNHGVSVFNGQSWKNYDVLDGPLGERIFDIAVAPNDGSVWMATNVGLARYSEKRPPLNQGEGRGGVWTYFTRAEGLPSDQIAALAFNAKGDLFAGTQCDGLAIARAAEDYKTWRSVRGPEKMPNTPLGKGLPGNLINDVLVAKSGSVYVATTCGLARSFDDGASWDYIRGADWEARVRGLYKGPKPLPMTLPGDLMLEDYSTCLAEDTKGQIYVGHWRRGYELRDARGDRRVGSVTQSLPDGFDYVRTVAYSAERATIGFYGAGALSLEAGKRNAEFQLPGSGNALPVPVTSNVNTKSRPIIFNSGNAPKFEPIVIGSPQKIATSIHSNAAPVRSDIKSSGPFALKPQPVPSSSPAPTGDAPPVLIAKQAPNQPSTIKVPVLEAASGIKPIPLPSPAQTSALELTTLLAKVQSSKSPTEQVAAYAGEDWTTRSDWVGRYGRQVGVLCGVMNPFDHRFFWDPDYTVDPQNGPHHTDDSLRAWLPWIKTTNTNVLYDPILGYRRFAEWDDHGEAYSATHEGPDTWIAVGLPKGLHRLSLYFFNNDGKGGNNRLRDYLIELKPYAPTPAQASLLPTLAHARVRDFSSGSVYKQFLVKGGTRYYLKIARSGSFNTIVSGLFIDKLAGPATYFDKLPMAWLGDVRYDPPQYQNIEEEISTQAPVDAEALQRAEELWLSVKQSIDRDGMTGLHRPARIMAYRAALKAGASEKLLANWRWTLCLWTPADRAEFKTVMERAYQAQLKVTPEIRGN